MEHSETMPEDYPVPEDPWNPIEPTEPVSGHNDNIEPTELDPVGADVSRPSLPDPSPTSPPGQPPPIDRPEAETVADLPPEAQGEANGGPLGCCLGVTIGLVLSLSIAIFGRLYLANPLADVVHNPLLVLILLRIVMAIVTIGGAILLGIVGWRVGKRLFREYEPPVVPVRQKRKRRRTKIRPGEAS